MGPEEEIERRRSSQPMSQQPGYFAACRDFAAQALRNNIAPTELLPPHVAAANDARTSLLTQFVCHISCTGSRIKGKLAGSTSLCPARGRWRSSYLISKDLKALQRLSVVTCRVRNYVHTVGVRQYVALIIRQVIGRQHVVRRCLVLATENILKNQL